jgi:hypothetical protein
VILKKVIVENSRIEVEVDQQETARELTSPFLFGRPVKKGEPGIFIEFIGPGGEVLETASGNQASCEAEKEYLRCMITHRVKKEDGSLREYYAWTQPVFTDGR